jgi:hypothetical protein
MEWNGVVCVFGFSLFLLYFTLFPLFDFISPSWEKVKELRTEIELKDEPGNFPGFSLRRKQRLRWRRKLNSLALLTLIRVPRLQLGAPQSTIWSLGSGV